jgi:hypothetical protein
MRRKAGISASMVGFTFPWLVETRIYCTSFLSKYKRTQGKALKDRLSFIS